MIGAVSLSALARLLEDFSKARLLAPVKALNDLFLQEWLSYEERLSVFKAYEGEKKAFSASSILEALEPLDDAMEEMDIDTADEIINRIQAYEMPANIKELSDKLAVAVLNLDTEEEHEIVEKMRELLHVV